MMCNLNLLGTPTGQERSSRIVRTGEAIVEGGSMRPSLSRSKFWTKCLQSHPVAFAFLLPFVVMLAAHEYFGMSDAMMVLPKPGEPDSRLYNAAMLGTFYLGVTGFVWHVFAIARRSILWITVKLLILAALWTGMLMWALE